MKFLVCLVTVLAVTSASEKKEKRGLLGLGYGHGAIAEPLTLGHSLPFAAGYGHGIELSAPIVSAPIATPVLKSYSAPVSYSAPISYSAPAISYSAPLLTKSYAAPIAPAISYSAPLLTKSYAAPIAAPIITKSFAAPISYSAPLLTKSYAAPALLPAPIIKSYAAPAIAAPISLGHGYSGLSLGYGKYLH